MGSFGFPSVTTLGAIYHQPLEVIPKQLSNDRDKNGGKHNLMKS